MLIVGWKCWHWIESIGTERNKMLMRRRGGVLNLKMYWEEFIWNTPEKKV